ncbi:MAG: hypothetical protein EA424_09900, partial [Planctomycetaceae bacterium]
MEIDEIEHGVGFNGVRPCVRCQVFDVDRHVIATYDDPAPGSGNVLNELVFEYNDLGMPIKEYQEHQGAKHGNTLSVQYDYDTTASGGVFTHGL